MHGCRRGAVALVLALIAGFVAPAAAFAAPVTTTTKAPKPPKKSTSTTRPTPGTTTTTIDPKSVPPPPAFSLPLDLGLQLLAQRDQANKDLASYSSALPGDRANAKVAEQRWQVLQRRLDKLRKRVRETQHDLDLAHAAIQAAAVEAYMNSGSSRLTAAISALATASSALDASRSMLLIGSFGDQQNALANEYVALEKKLTAEKQKVQAQKDAADVMLASAKAKVTSDNTEIAHAHVRLTATVIGILQFEQAATSASSPILGPTQLTAQQLVDFVSAMHYTPRLTVSIDDLAKDYITEGHNAGVRGDVAFAQSILETGGFSFPGGGQVLVNDNNFAGIGACDSCKHGFSFATAQIGVRAQMQALRIYVDPNLTATTLKQPLVMPKMLNLGFRGRVQTWWDLWGTWATGAFYGQRVYDIYTRMVEFAKTDPAHPPGTPIGTPMPPAP
jgi:Mannosyl-glycoprotein endo-beta-N-acetylglucosaminidase